MNHEQENIHFIVIDIEFCQEEIVYEVNYLFLPRRKHLISYKDCDCLRLTTWLCQELNNKIMLEPFKGIQENIHFIVIDIEFCQEEIVYEVN